MWEYYLQGWLRHPGEEERPSEGMNERTNERGESSELNNKLSSCRALEFKNYYYKLYRTHSHPSLLASLLAAAGTYCQ